MTSTHRDTRAGQATDGQAIKTDVHVILISVLHLMLSR